MNKDLEKLINKIVENNKILTKEEQEKSIILNQGLYRFDVYMGSTHTSLGILEKYFDRIFDEYTDVIDEYVKYEEEKKRENKEEKGNQEKEVEQKRKEYKTKDDKGEGEQIRKPTEEEITKMRDVFDSFISIYKSIKGSIEEMVNFEKMLGQEPSKSVNRSIVRINRRIKRIEQAITYCDCVEEMYIK